MDLQALIITSVVGLVSAIIGSGIFALIAQRKKTAAEVVTEEETAKKVAAETEELRSRAAKIIRDSSGELVMEYKAQIAELRKELEETTANLTSQIDELRNELTIAYAKIKHQDETIRGLNRRISDLSK